MIELLMLALVRPDPARFCWDPVPSAESYRMYAAEVGMVGKQVCDGPLCEIISVVAPPVWTTEMRITLGQECCVPINPTNPHSLSRCCAFIREPAGNLVYYFVVAVTGGVESGTRAVRDTP